MVGTISPVVYRAVFGGRYKWYVAAAIYTIGSIAGGGLTGALLGLLGEFLTTLISGYRLYFPLFVGLLAIAYSLHEFRMVSLPFPQIRRQVPPRWRKRFHPYVTAGVYGLILGLGFTTFIPTASYHVLGLAVVLQGSPIFGILIFTIYGAGRAALLWPISFQSTKVEMLERIDDHMSLTKPVIHQLNGLLLVILGAYLLSTHVLPIR